MPRIVVAMLARLIIGLVKGLVVGALVGFGLVKLGMAMPIAVVAYLAAAVTGVLIGLVAGKPIWAKDARIEAGMKAIVGALLGAGLMFAVRRWLDIPLPFALPEVLTGGTDPAKLTIGNYAMTSLAAIAAVLGGFYEADNTPDAEQDKAKASSPSKAGTEGSKKRITSTPADDEDLDEDAGFVDDKRAKK